MNVQRLESEDNPLITSPRVPGTLLTSFKNLKKLMLVFARLAYFARFQNKVVLQVNT